MVSRTCPLLEHSNSYIEPLLSYLQFCRFSTYVRLSLGSNCRLDMACIRCNAGIGIDANIFYALFQPSNENIHALNWCGLEYRKGSGYEMRRLRRKWSIMIAAIARKWKICPICSRSLYSINLIGKKVQPTSAFT